MRLTGTSFTNDRLPTGTPTTLLAKRKVGSSEVRPFTGYWQRSSDADIARIVFPDDGSVDSLVIEGKELMLR